jgi:PAS domain S-box-containing protein
MVAITSYLRRSPPRAGDPLAPHAAICALITILFAVLTAIETNTSGGSLPLQTGTVLGLALCGLNLLHSSYKTNSRPPQTISLALSVMTISIAIVGSLPALSNPSNRWLGEVGDYILLAPNVGLALFIFGLGTCATQFAKRTIARRYIPAVSGAATASLGLIAVTGYITGLPFTYAWTMTSPMSLMAALAIVLLGLGMINVVLRSDNSARRRTYTSLAISVLIVGFTVSGFTGSMLYDAQVKSAEEVIGIVVTDSDGISYNNQIPAFSAGVQTQITIKVGEEDWTVTTTKPESLLNGASRFLPHLAVTLGVILTLLLYSSILTVQTSLKRSRALAKANAQLEAEVNARQQVQNALEREIVIRRKTEAVITTDRERLDLALSAGGTGTWHLDPQTGQLDVDQQSLDLFGFTTQTFKGTYESFKKVVLPEDLSRVERAVNQALNGGADFEQDFRIIKPDGAVHVIYGRARVIESQHDKKTLMIGINQDVTERRRAEKLSTLGTLAAGFAHELNNPLMGCVNYVAYALRKTENARARDALVKAEAEIKRVTRVVQDMLSFSRFKQDLSAHANVNDALEHATNLTSASFKTSGITFENRIKSPLPLAAISADALEQIVLNLIINAGHAVETSDSKTISIDADQNSDNIFISVSDSGCGIPEHVGRRLFEPFFTTKKAGKGSGLGLSISLDIIKRFGGRIEFESTPGVGTTFVVTLPKLKTYEDQFTSETRTL